MNVLHSLSAACLAAMTLVLVGDPDRSVPDTRQETVNRIIEEALTRGEAYSLLRSLCETAPHRLSGSKGAADAVEWGRAKMTELGFENVRLEPCTVPHWERGEVEELVFTAPEKLMGLALPILALGGSVATPERGVEAEVVVVTSFEELAALGEGARGRIVLFNRPMDDASINTFRAYGGAVGQRGGGASQAAMVGGVAAIVRSMTTQRDDVPHTGAMGYAPNVERIPTAAVSTNGADRIAALIAAGETVKLRLRLDCRTLEPEESFNFVGELVGTEMPEEIIVVGGHLDAWDVGEGAHDDGAGCVQAMEVLRLLDVLDLRPRRTIRCVLFMNEENGLAGGNAYYDAHRDELDRHVLAMESDRGGFTPRGFTAGTTDAAREVIEDLVGLVAITGALTVTSGGGGADIGPMRAGGVPLIGYVPDGQRYFDFHHSANDVFAAVNERELHLGAAAMAGLVWLIADMPGTLPRAVESQ
jgi:carboxypeptidase Q